MKSLLLSLSILACLWVGCSDDEDGNKMPHETYYGFHVTDTVGLVVDDAWGVEFAEIEYEYKRLFYRFYEGTLADERSVYLVGTKQGKLWIGKFDRYTKEQLRVWTSGVDFSRQRCIDPGYGEPVWEYDAWLEIEDVLVQDEEHVYLLVRLKQYPSSIGEEYYDMYFIHGDDITMFLDIENEKCGEFIEWADGYCDLRNAKFYSQDGDVIYELATDGQLGSFVNWYEVSREEAVIRRDDYRVVYFRRKNLRTGEVLWESETVNLDVEEDARVEADFSSLELWIYTVKITHRDGTTETRDFRLNVENGWIEEI